MDLFVTIVMFYDVDLSNIFSSFTRRKKSSLTHAINSRKKFINLETIVTSRNYAVTYVHMCIYIYISDDIIMSKSNTVYLCRCVNQPFFRKPIVIFPANECLLQIKPDIQYSL